MFMVRKLAIITVAFLVTIEVQGKIESTEEQASSIKVKTQISVTKEEFLVGEPIPMRTTVTNRNSEMIRIFNLLYLTLDFSAKDSSGRLVKGIRKPWLTGLSRTIAVPPASDFNDVVFMNEYLDFPRPDFYTVTYKGSILFRIEPLESRGTHLQTVPVSGVVNVRLRQGLDSELESALREYLKLLKSGNRQLESQAARALSVSEPTLAAKLLRQAVTDESGAYPSYTSQVTWALARIGTDEAIQVLSDIAMHYKNTMARTDAIDELGRQHIKKAVPTLVTLLSDQDSKIRVSTLRALGCIGDKRRIPEIKLMLTDPDKEVRATAENVYNMLTKNEQ